MTFVWTWAASPSLVAAVLCLIAIVFAWRSRGTPVGTPLIATLSGTWLWMLCDALVTLGGDLQTKLMAYEIAHLGMGVIPVGYAVMALRVTDRAEWTSASSIAAASIVPLAAFLLIASNDVHGFMYHSPRLEVDSTPPRLMLNTSLGYWIYVAHQVALLLLATLVSVRGHWREWSPFRLDAWIGYLTVGLPIAAMAADALRFAPLPDWRWTPLAMMLSASIVAWGLRRTGMLEIVRIGRNHVLDGMSDGVFVVDATDRLVDINSAALEILSLDGVRPASQPVGEVFAEHPDILELLRGAIEGRSELHLQRAGARPEQRTIYDLEIFPLYDAWDRMTGRVVVLHDITDRVRTQQELHREGVYVQLLQEVSVASNEAGSSDEILLQSLRHIARAKGWSIGHALVPTRDGSALVTAGLWYTEPPGYRSPFIEALEAAQIEQGVGVGGRTLQTQRPSWLGDTIDLRDAELDRLAAAENVQFHAALPVIVSGAIFAVLEFYAHQADRFEPKLRDVLANVGLLIGRSIERHQFHEKVRRLAYRDSLTNLPNREAFQTNLETALEAAETQEHRVALLFMDLDGFKKINDTLGHRAGDEILREVATRFSSVLRRGDVVARASLDHTVARLGGDEFTVLLTRIDGLEDVERVAHRLIDTLASPIDVDGQEIFANTSVGIAVFPDDGRSADELLTRADAAMYFAKSRGTNRHQFYSASMASTSSERLQLEGKLRGALGRGDLHLYYQPLRDARSGELTGAEVLLRWIDPHDGMIGPDLFIPIAEEMGMIVEIGSWVLESACFQLRDWLLRGYAPLRMSVNVSSRQLRERSMAGTLENLLHMSGCSPGLIELEITESSIMQDDETTRDTLRQITDMGVGLALDDFGTGYSSLTHLRSFPIDRVKIDRSFVAEMMNDDDDAALTRAIIAMAHGLRVKVVAEGVETDEQARFLQESGCDELQGYLLGKPVPAAEFERNLRRVKSNGA